MGGFGGVDKGREKMEGNKTKEDEEEEEECGGRGQRGGELSQMHASGALHNLSTAVLHSFVSPTCLIPRLVVSFLLLEVFSLCPPESREFDFFLGHRALSSSRLSIADHSRLI